MAKIPLTINDQPCQVESGRTILEACRDQNVHLPVLCHLDGLTDVGACRLCLVELEGSPRLLPACTTHVAPNQRIRTQTDKLRRYRRMTLELFFAERNHICSVCIANNNCELQDLAVEVGMDHVRFPYLYQKCDVDASHPDFVMDHNRCIMCTRCVRACGEVEGAHTWDVKNRGYHARIISDFDTPWGDSTTCTSCGKCVESCPTGALWPKETLQGMLHKTPTLIGELVSKRAIGL